MATWCKHQFFLTLFCFSCQVWLLAQIPCQYHHWFWSYENFLYKGLTRNPELGNTPVWVLHDIFTLGRVMNTKLGTIVSNEMLLNAANCQGYSFYCFWIIKRKQTGDNITLIPPTRLGLRLQINLRLKPWNIVLLHEGKASLSTAQWNLWVIAQSFGIGSNFSTIRFFMQVLWKKTPKKLNILKKLVLSIRSQVTQATIKLLRKQLTTFCFLYVR